MRVVIAGGGAIGAATAFFLAERGVEVVVVERHAVAGSASGKAGGFLALDWCDGTALDPLARRSFALHAQLAARFDNPWDYRRLETFAVAASARRRLGRGAPALDWLAEGVAVEGRLGDETTTAQVHPGRFTEGLLARARGARVVPAKVEGLLRRGERATGLRTDGGDLEGDAIVVALGPWSALVGDGAPRVHGVPGPSLILENPRPLPPHALFAQVETEAGEVHGPEIFTRPDGTTYVCGVPSGRLLPDDPAAVRPVAGDEAALRAALAPLAPELAAAPARVVQACHRPATDDGLPAIGPWPDAPGAWIATGHNVWGILNAPATGEALAAAITG
ncbi:MAG: FAD-dependent oxidoreductase, partial [Alphaproteobacteria bacterium]|nr:FAD-dependent oxidoreductase [Alphaproteobacteria bacterium]